MMNEKPVQESNPCAISGSVSYTVKGKVFVVEPVYQSSGTETLGEVLIRLMKSDIAES